MKKKEKSTKFLRQPEQLPDWPDIDGYESVFVGRSVFQEMVPAGVAKFGTWCADGKGWEITDFERGNLYPVGHLEQYTVFYYRSPE